METSQTSNNKQISIIIPTYNYGHLLSAAVTSVMKQMKPNHELIVVDDGSTDNTEEVISSLNLSYQHKINYIRKDNAGPASARNTGYKHAQGEFIIFLDADDELVADALEKITQHIESNIHSKFIIGGHLSKFKNGKTKLHSPSKLPEDAYLRLKAYLLDKSLGLSNGACVMHRDIFEFGYYPEEFRNNEDIPVFAQALANVACSTINSPLSIINKHDDSLRHQFHFSRNVGLALVDEVFSDTRQPTSTQSLKRPYYVQRCLSLFRSAYLAKEYDDAGHFYFQAIKENWKVVFNISYTRKALLLLSKLLLNK